MRSVPVPHQVWNGLKTGVTDAAMKMLATGKLPLSEIAFRSGFSSQATFTRAFRRATNMTLVQTARPQTVEYVKHVQLL